MATWEQLDFVRTATVNTLEKIDENKWDKQPEGFSNTIKWNAGHIYVSLESFLKAADSEFQTNVEEYAPFFGMGTKPSEWPDNAPSKEQIIQLLTDQKTRVQQHFKDRLSDQPANEIKIGPLSLNTINDVINFSLFHEGLHLGVIQAQLKIL
ncbi:DinB family protein [Bacillus aerolatus]|uniref:DinB family protein n=1 Tax=Bacillus aerolatus TaxID=2653354 RepID=A0A6I1G0J4_9BACI|nr:DinB family protein [Bacillus aerolatus]KAB7709136.1 DinB family protein [Bacillus aerolatus]